ncbi:MAG TPA: bifunctional metallophosphatase/5'-nucleotidase [Rhodothermales bacterium]|nr:bifunctional metallophosphatase/5'-nucleotidase [Rhodothermales bacterium]
MRNHSNWKPVVTLLHIRSFVLGLTLVAAGCSRTAQISDAGGGIPRALESGRIAEVTLLQINDVYEITPAEGGRSGGLARVATLRRQLLAENPNTFTVLAGDFLSPSALGTARVDGERLAGKQMVAVLNAVGVDFVTFGNHEFDLSRDQLASRIAESEFVYISGNVFDNDGRPFPGAEPYRIIEIPSSGDTLRIGVIAVTAPFNQAEYVSYEDYTEVVKRQAALLRPNVHILVALTHLALAQDVGLAQEVPELDLILGGHEHENVQLWRGPDMTPIVKADANVRSVYVHRLRYDFDSSTLAINIDLELITDQIEDDPATAAIVNEWLDRAWDGFRSGGFDPAAPVVTIAEPLDGREAVVRNQPSALTKLIAQGMRSAAGDVDLAIFNSGSIRIDDVLPPGLVTEYDVIRVLPFGGEILTVEMTGGLLDSVLTQGVENKGAGGFLQVDGAAQDGVFWRVGDELLLPRHKYRVAVNDFLVSGRERGLGYLTFDDPRITKIDSHGDIRMAVIAELKRRYR